ncbi:amino acid permease/ SLC12A domain-containing protein [Mycena rosella]|uniref:Amino acid permease/ SLC12A domain-containing protein n=1 Tax=Mycena rosella TaxID=1033263 RepID=A0AAD7GHM5_MYCRO|nr:amino acid permease/ SLC12A domain-containing protein [Mycena rosella]
MAEKVDEKEYPKSPSIQESFAHDSTAGDIYHGEHKLVRQLKNRHIAMISIGGVIGTGLFWGQVNGKKSVGNYHTHSLRHGGPIGLLLGYLAVGTITYSVMISLGEMVAYLPIPGGHIKLAERFVDPAFSFTMGWNYWYNWIIVLPAELSAASVLINFWNKSVNDAVRVDTIIMVVVVAINMCGAGVYGEAEFIFASIKVITITGLIILGIVLDLGGGPDHDRLGFRYWKHPGALPYNGISGVTGQFLGWWAVMTQAAFSYIGTEIVAIAAGEAKNPRRNLPKAIRRVYIRILLFYIGGVIVIGLLVPSSDPGLQLGSGTAASSPFALMILSSSGIKALPSIINACLLTSAWSAGSSDLYTSSRALCTLAVAGNAPRIFLKTLSNGLPIASIAFCSLFSGLAYMGVTAGSGKVFGWFANMTAIAGLLTWFGICLTYIRFYKGMKAQGYDRKHLPFASPLQPFAAWYALIFCIVICFFSGWATFLKGNWVAADFVTNYLPLGMFPVMYAGAKYYYYRKGTPIAWKAYSDLDFVTDIAEIEADMYDDPPPRNKAEAFWQWLVRSSQSLIQR